MHIFFYKIIKYLNCFFFFGLRSQCEPISGLGFRRGSYKCVCRKGFYFPDITLPQKYFNGSTLEEEYEKLMLVSLFSRSFRQMIESKKRCFIISFVFRFETFEFVPIFHVQFKSNSFVERCIHFECNSQYCSADRNTRVLRAFIIFVILLRAIAVF